MIVHTTLPGGSNKGLQKYRCRHSKGCTKERGERHTKEQISNLK